MDSGKQGTARIGFVSRLPPVPCGIATTYVGLLPHLQKKAHLVTIGVLGSKADYQVDFKAWNLKEQVQSIVEKEQLDLVHFQYIAPFYSKALNLNFLRALRLSVPVVVTLHEVQEPGTSFRNKALRFIERRIVEKADAIIVHTPKQAEFINKAYQTDKASCILYGFEPKNIKRKTGKRVLFFGILSESKGVEYAIEAVKGLKGVTLSIVAATNSPQTKVYGERVKALSKGKKNIQVVLKDWIDTKARDIWYANSDVLVLPYLWAPYQSAVMTDAGKYGIPVVVTKVGAVWEMVGKFGCGEIVEPRNAKALANALKTVLEHQEKYKQGIEAYRKEASWSAVAEQHLNLYERILR
ncbi:MAG: glycosyltransferase family 4 protein [Nanoarchaeota archaeon]|nr:glycosyltransferase family 4 protein [Nanoarchaeota archaeon]